MNALDLLSYIGNADEKYIVEALHTKFGTNRVVHKKMNKKLLIAAIIATFLLLAGCVAVYLSFSDFSIGTEKYTQRYDSTGLAIAPTEKNKAVLSVAPAWETLQKAQKEWHDFSENYDPEQKLYSKLPDTPNLSEIPDSYEYTYGCYTTDMVEQLNRLAEKYNLKLLDAGIVVQKWQADVFLEETGLQLLKDSNAKLDNLQGICYPPSSFRMNFDLTTGERKMYGLMEYDRKDYFPRDNVRTFDLDQMEQWEYTTKEGRMLLLGLTPEGKALITADMKEAMLTIRLDYNLSGSMYVEKDMRMSRQELEIISEVFNYDLSPREIRQDRMQEKLDQAEMEYQNTKPVFQDTYQSFDAYLTTNIQLEWINWKYVYYDVDGDGTQELLLGRDGKILYIASVKDGQLNWNYRRADYLCQENACLSIIDENYTEDVLYQYYKFPGDPMDPKNNYITAVAYHNGQWYRIDRQYASEGEKISQEAANTILERYVPISFSWKKLTDFRLQSGETLGEYMQVQNPPISHEAVQALYQDHLSKRSDNYYTHYHIMDLDGDGREDLLLSNNGSTFSYAVTYMYGNIQPLLMDQFYLCRDHVLECVDIRREPGDLAHEYELHEFAVWRNNRFEIVDHVILNKATGQWQTDYDGTVIPDEKAEAIFKKYPRLEQEMLPIS